MFRNRRFTVPTGLGLVLFLIVAVVLAGFIARVVGFLMHIVFQLVWYAIAFAVAVAVLSWIWGRLTQTRAVDRPRWDRQPDERRYH